MATSSPLRSWIGGLNLSLNLENYLVILAASQFGVNFVCTIDGLVMGMGMGMGMRVIYF